MNKNIKILLTALNFSVVSVQSLHAAAAGGDVGVPGVRPEARPQNPEYRLQQPHLDLGERPVLPFEPGANFAAAAAGDHNPLEAYRAYSPQQRDLLHDDLRLKNGIVVVLEEDGAVRARISNKQAVVWREPGQNAPQIRLSTDAVYSITRSMHEFRSSRTTKFEVGLRFFGFGVATEYQDAEESLRRCQETSIHLHCVYVVPKIELSIDKRNVAVSPDLEQRIRETVRNQDIDSLGILLAIFAEYGFCVPTRFILGGSMNFQETKTVESVVDARNAENAFSASVGITVDRLLAGAGGGHAAANNEVAAHARMDYRNNYTMVGGRAELRGNVAEWMASLVHVRNLGVIEHDNFEPVIDFLEPGLQDLCYGLIRQLGPFWNGYLERDLREKNISLPALQAAFSKTRLPRLRHIAPQDERDYRRFLYGKLVYKPNRDNDIGKIELRIGQLANPLDGTFDLTQCGDSSRYLSIATGYRKVKKPENAGKLEIWLAPRFLIASALGREAAYFQPIMDYWNGDAAPVGIFWNHGECDDLTQFDSLVSGTLADLSGESLWEKFQTWSVITKAMCERALFLRTMSLQPPASRQGLLNDLHDLRRRRAANPGGLGLDPPHNPANVAPRRRVWNERAFILRIIASASEGNFGYAHTKFFTVSFLE